MAVKAKAILIAGAVGIGLGMVALLDRPERPSSGMVVVAGPATTPEFVAKPSPPPVMASMEATPQTEDAVAAQASAAPANYTYWEGGDPGVWGTPAQFSGAR